MIEIDPGQNMQLIHLHALHGNISRILAVQSDLPHKRSTGFPTRVV